MALLWDFHALVGYVKVKIIFLDNILFSSYINKAIKLGSIEEHIIKLLLYFNIDELHNGRQKIFW